MEKRSSPILGRIRIVFLILCFSFSCYVSNAQEKCRVLGYVHTIDNVFDLEISKTVLDYTAVLITDSDTLNYYSKNGDFIFRDIEPGTVTIQIHKTGYYSFTDIIVLTEGDQAVTIELFRETEELESAIVSAAQPIITMKQDTIVFHANAVKRMAGDFAIDLLAQMPGAEISEAGIFIGGKSVSHAYVNGVLVFGRNPLDAMRNLSADTVVSMNIYDEAPIEDNGRDLAKVRVIDILTNVPIVDVTDIQALLSAGSDEEKDVSGEVQKRYLAGISANFFSESLQLKTDILLNNIGEEQSIALGTDAFSTPASALTSHSVKNKAAFHLEKYWGRNYLTRTGLQLDYSYNDDYIRSPKKTISEYYPTNIHPARTVTDSTSSVNKLKSHQLTGAFQKSFGNLKMTWKNSMSFSQADNFLFTSRKTAFSETTIKENSSNNQHNSTWMINENVYLRGMAFRNHSYEVTMFIDAENGDGDGSIIDLNEISSIPRWLVKTNQINSLNTGVHSAYIIPLSPKNHASRRMMFDVTSEYVSKKNSQKGINYLTPTPQLDEVNTYDNSFKQVTNKFGFRYDEKFMHIGLSLWQSHQNKTVYSLVPSLELFNGKGLNLSLSSSMVYPTMNQLVDRIDNTNPVYLVTGNPNLKPSQNYILDIRLFKGGLSQGWRLITNYADSPIVSRNSFYSSSTVLTEYNGFTIPSGAMLYSYDNADYQTSTTLSYRGGRSLDFSKKLTPISLNYSFEAKGASKPAYLMDVLYRTKDLSGMTSVNSVYTVSTRMRFTFNTGAEYVKTTSKISDKVIERINWNYAIGLKYTPKDIVLIETSYSNQSNVVLGENVVRMNNFLKISIGANLAEQRVKLLFEAIDLLNNNSVYTTSITDNSFTQSFAPVYGKYFLLTFKYRFNSSQNRLFNSSFNN